MDNIGVQPLDFRLFLQDELVRRCASNHRYSLRAFARALGSDVSTLSKILNGKRTLGPRAVRSWSSRLGLDPGQVERLTGKTSDVDYTQLSLDSFKVVSDWYHFALLELLRVSDFQSDARWMARRLGITASEVNVAMQRMTRLGLAAKDADGRWQDTSGGKSTTVGTKHTAAAFRKLQRQLLEKAVIALEDEPYATRDISAMTMAIDASRLEDARSLIKDFRRQLAAFLSRGGKTPCSVYNLSIALYPLTTTFAEHSDGQKN